MLLLFGFFDLVFFFLVSFGDGSSGVRGWERGGGGGWVWRGDGMEWDG